MCAALLQLVEGVSSRAVWNYLNIGTSTASEALKQIFRLVVKHFKDEYLRTPTVEELKVIATEYEQMGFPGCIGCLDCAGWEWEACPVVWKGNCVSAGKKPTMRLETVWDVYLSCLHLGFGVPGSKNDLNILYASKLFQIIRQGMWPPSRPLTSIAGFSLPWLYYCTDGINPDWWDFVKTVKNPTNKKEKTFGRQQECVRKAIERFFGVLFRKYRILRNPGSLWHKEDMTDVMEACDIMHNMTVRERKARYTGTREARIRCVSAEAESTGVTTYCAMVPPHHFQRVNWLHEVDGHEESREHHSLRKKHRWNTSTREEVIVQCRRAVGTNLTPALIDSLGVHILIRT